MGKRMSYNENMKNYAERNQKVPKVSIVDVYSQMVMDVAWFKLKKEQLETAIDKSLETRDREKFMMLSSEYKRLLEVW